MERRAYYGIVHKDTNSDFGISFPDFPGCVSAGSTLEELKENAVEALQMHIDGMLEDFEPVPDATPSADVHAESEQNGGSAVIVIAVNVPENALKRINITIKTGDLKAIDRYIDEHEEEKSRSAFLAKCARRIIKYDTTKAAGGPRRGGRKRLRKPAAKKVTSPTHHPAAEQ